MESTSTYSRSRKSGADAVLAAALTIAAVAWLLAIVLAPLAASSGRGTWAAALAYQIGSLICHQRPERSFHLAGVQLPVCARCFGLYAAGAAGLLLAAAGFCFRWPSTRARAALAASAIPIVLTVVLEWTGTIETGNLLRMATGLPLGVMAGLVFGGLLRPAR